MLLKMFQDSVNSDSVKLSMKIALSFEEGKLSHLFEGGKTKFEVFLVFYLRIAKHRWEK